VEKISPETRVEVTGNPRFDLVQNPHRKIYSERADQLNNRYGNYILFNTNFSVNGEYSMEKRDKITLDEETSIVDENRDALQKDVKIFARLLELIAETAEEYPERSVVIRPHPSENPDFYIDSFYAYENVHVDKRFEVRPWIIGGEVVVHNSCTTGIESLLLDTPVIAYLPNGMERNETPNNISERYTAVADVVDAIGRYLVHNKKFDIDANSKSEVRPHIDNLEYLSVERVADVIDSITTGENRKNSMETDIKLALRRTLVRTIGSKRFEELWVKRLRGESRHKFEYVETTTVDSIIEQFSDEIKPSGLKINRLPYMVNGFRVRTVEG
jgi:hypothetical protein